MTESLRPAVEKVSQAATQARINNESSGGTAVTDLYAAVVEARVLAGTLADYIDTLRAGLQPDADPVNAQIDHHLAQAANTLRAAAYRLTEAGEALGNGHTYPETALAWLRQRANTRPFEPVTTNYVPARAPYHQSVAKHTQEAPTAPYLTAARQSLNEAGRAAYRSSHTGESSFPALYSSLTEAGLLSVRLADYIDTLRDGFQVDHPDADPRNAEADHEMALAVRALQSADRELNTARTMLRERYAGPDDAPEWDRLGVVSTDRLAYFPAPDRGVMPPPPAPSAPELDQAEPSVWDLPPSPAEG